MHTKVLSRYSTGDNLSTLVEAAAEAFRSITITRARNVTEAIRDQQAATARLIGNPKSIPVVTTLFYSTEFMMQSIIHVLETTGMVV